MTSMSDIDLVPPESVAAVAKRALEMRAEQPPSRQGGTPVGVKRASQLANRENLSPRTIQRMVSFFARHEVDKKAEGFNKGEDGFPSKGRQAWDLWGGDPGKAWAEKMAAKLNQKESTEMIDVNVLTGADIRRTDGKHGKISRVSLPWVTVEWSDGGCQSFVRSDPALSEQLELKTLDKGWVSLGSLIGKKHNKETVMSVSEANSPVSELLAETRLLKRRLMISEAAKDRKSSAKAKTKELLKKKKAKGKAKGKEGSGGKKHSPYKRLSSRGQPPEKASKFTGFSDNFFGKKGLTKMPKSGKWDCKKSGKYRQVCTNSETGAKKIIVIDPGYKKSYNAGYAKASAAGQTNAANAKG